MDKYPLHILVLHEAVGPGARADELDALVQAEQVSRAIRKLGWRISVLPTDLDLKSTMLEIARQAPSCVFNLVESLGGNGRLIHLFPSLLESAGVAFTGAGDDAMVLSSQKPLAKQWMRLHGIATPDWFLPDAEIQDRGSQWIVKSTWEHASFGMDDGCLVTGAAAARSRIEECKSRHGGDWFAERYIDGREFNISVLEQNGQSHVLPIAEMTFVDYPRGKPRIVGYAAKWDENAPEYHATRRTFPSLSSTEQQALNDLVRKCWTVFGLAGYARIDLRVDSEGRPWVLEVNANPCLSLDAGFPAAALQAGIRYERLVERIVHAALRPALREVRRAG